MHHIYPSSDLTKQKLHLYIFLSSQFVCRIWNLCFPLCWKNVYFLFISCCRSVKMIWSHVWIMAFPYMVSANPKYFKLVQYQHHAATGLIGGAWTALDVVGWNRSAVAVKLVVYTTDTHNWPSKFSMNGMHIVENTNIQSSMAHWIDSVSLYNVFMICLAQAEGYCNWPSFEKPLYPWCSVFSLFHKSYYKCWHIPLTMLSIGISILT